MEDMQGQIHISDSLKDKDIDKLTEEDLDKIITPRAPRSQFETKGTARYLIKISGEKVN